jgi:hypothetical protein
MQKNISNSKTFFEVPHQYRTQSTFRTLWIIRPQNGLTCFLDGWCVRTTRSRFRNMENISPLHYPALMCILKCSSEIGLLNRKQNDGKAVLADFNLEI